MKKVTTFVLLITFLLSLTAIPLFGARSNVKKNTFKEGEILIKFKKGTSENSKAKVNVKLKAKKLKSFDFIGMEHIKLPPGKSVEQAIEDYIKLPEIEYAEPNHIKQLLATPNDEHFSSLWGLTKSKLPAAWDITKGTSGTIVAVLDTGVAYTHPDLQPSMWTNPGEIAGNGVDDDNNGYVDDHKGINFGTNEYVQNNPMDIDDHGTHVAGTIGAKGDNTIGVTGVNWNMKIMPVNVFSGNGESASTSDIIEGINYVRTMKLKGNIIVAVNSSYGGGLFSQFEYNAIAGLKSAGVLLVAAAGNDGKSNDQSPEYPANYNLDNIISVAATDSSDNLAGYSNYGNSIDIAAPGSGILSTVLYVNETFVSSGSTYFQSNEMTFSGITSQSGITATAYNCGKGLGPSDFPAEVLGNIALIERGEANFSVKAANAKNAGAVGVIIYNNEEGNFLGTLSDAGDWLPIISISRADGLVLAAQDSPTVTLMNRQTFGYESFNGTSMATPHVTGVAALLASYNPNLSYLDIKNRILKGTDKLSSLTGKVSTGGRLNAYRAFDITAPALSATAPANGKYIKGYLSLSGTATDPKGTGYATGVRNIKIYRDSTLLKTFSTGSFAYKYNTALVKGGKYIFKIIATDKAGNTYKWARYYYIDNTKPTVPRMYLQPSVPKKGTLATAYYRVADTYSPKVSVALQIRKTTGGTIISKSLGLQSKDVLLKSSIRVPSTAGRYIYRVIATDRAGNKNWKDIYFSVQ